MSTCKKIFGPVLIALLYLTSACGETEPASTPSTTEEISAIEPASTLSPTEKISATESDSTPSTTEEISATESDSTPSTTEENGAIEPADSPSQKSAPESTPSKLLNTAWDDRSIFRQGLIEAEREVLDRLPGATVYHLQLEISDDLLTLTGQQTVHYTNNEAEPLNDVYFRLFPNTAGGRATVSEVTVDGAEAELAYEFDDSALRVHLSPSLQPGDMVDIQMTFEVEIPQEMAGNYGLFGLFDGVLVLDEFYPVIPAYDDEGWNVEAPSPNGDLTHFDTSFYLVRVAAPKNLTIVASGIEISQEIDGNYQTLTLAAGPMRDFYLAASERFTLISGTVNETSINSYALEGYQKGAELALQVATASLSSFNERLGDYPYTEFDVVSAPMMALGMEYPAATTIALRTYDPEATISGLPSQVMLESVVAHEVAHQWFYSAVGNDQVDEPWLDEALVQYLTGRYYLDTYGPEAARSYADSWWGRWDRVEQAEIPIGLPTAAYAEGEYSAIVYGRGPIFVSALAEEMGQETFNEFLRDYYQSHVWGIGTGEAFRQLAEKHCQCDLSTLFQEWVYE